MYMLYHLLIYLSVFFVWKPQWNKNFVANWTHIIPRLSSSVCNKIWMTIMSQTVVFPPHNVIIIGGTPKLHTLGYPFPPPLTADTILAHMYVTHWTRAWRGVSMLVYITEVNSEELLYELVVGVVEVGLIMVKLKVLFLNYLLDGSWHWGRML